MCVGGVKKVPPAAHCPAPLRERMKFSEWGKERSASRWGWEWLEAGEGTPGAEPRPGCCSLDRVVLGGGPGAHCAGLAAVMSGLGMGALPPPWGELGVRW